MANESWKRQKRVYVYRHGPKASGPSKTGGANLAVPLSPAGEEMMMKAAKDHDNLHGSPVAVHVSPAVRTYQTGMFFAQISSRNFPQVKDCLIGRHEVWDSFVVKSSNPTARDFYKDKPRFIRQEALSIYLLLKRIVRGLRPGEHSVCVSHGALIEPTIATALMEMSGQSSFTAAMIPDDLQEGEFVVFVFETNNDFISVERQNE